MIQIQRIIINQLSAPQQFRPPQLKHVVWGSLLGSDDYNNSESSVVYK